MPLTAKQKLFAAKVAGGHSQSQAYREVYSSSGTSGTVRTEAHRLAKRPEIAAMIERLREPEQLKALRIRGREAGLFQRTR